MALRPPWRASCRPSVANRATAGSGRRRHSIRCRYVRATRRRRSAAAIRRSSRRDRPASVRPAAVASAQAAPDVAPTHPEGQPDGAAEQSSPEDRMTNHQVARAKRAQYAPWRQSAQIVDREPKLRGQHQGEQQAVDMMRGHCRPNAAPVRQQPAPDRGLARQSTHQMGVAPPLAGASRRTDRDAFPGTVEGGRGRL